MSPRSRGKSPYAALVSFDRLEVGPVRLERDRFFCPYTVVKGADSDTLELAYRFEEKVFDPEDPSDGNLAAMMGAQVALNYGLFTPKIVFHGPFDRADRRFLLDMAENTAREILVKKFLEPNPFLVGPAAGLRAVVRDRYLHAELEFPDPEPAAAASWNGDRARVCILSSGGKDSLLSFGLMKELGYETHPIFVNESGKHWFTALNAHRAMAARFPETSRVWTNSDRLFNWMVRHFPFIRPDFQRLRSDEYPIRLWTVAVFLFGALPLIKKRGLGRLIIGDEYDTSVRPSHEGIPHYDGLYDQSIFFDQALSRYFGKKGWNLSQFSLLRPLSEMLIEKTLAERYPDLLELQTSCHAAHVEGERVHPCGKCEKCRRVVGMLEAIGADPRKLGYSEAQIEDCMRALAEKGVHQEKAGARQLAYLLAERGLLPEKAPGLPQPRPHPEVLKLRFHPQVSPPASIPLDIRKPLYRALLEHAVGAAQKNGRVWIDCDILASADLLVPFTHESPSGTADPGDRKENTMSEDPKGDFILGELTWPQAEKKLAGVDVALLPVGSIEQHGPHLPLDTDAYDADYLCRRVAAACRDPKPVVLPLISYGVSYHHDSFKGTISVGPETLSRMVYEIGMSVARQGITKLVIINGHGGNGPALHFAAQLINRDAHIFTCVDTGETSDHDIDGMTETPNDVHAGEVETSTSLATRPELVDLKKAKKSVPRFSNRYLDFSSKRSVDWYVRTEKISTSGVLGDPTKASAEKGEKMWEVMVKNLVELVEGIKGLPLSEIHEKRY